MRFRHRCGVAPAALALAAALAIPFTGTAAAGEYQVYSCRTPSGAVAPTEGWTAPTHSGEDATLDTCEEAGGGLVAGLDAHVSHPAETDKVTWGFEAPSGETISAATLWRAGESMPLAESETSYAFWLAGVADSGPNTAVFEECEAKNCANRGSFSEPLSSANRVVVPQSALGSRYLYLNVSCASLVSPCAATEADETGYAASVELFAADLTLSQSQPPEVSNVSGSLAEASTVSGKADVAFEATDSGSGVYEVEFRVDGEVVSTVFPEEEGGRCRDVNTGGGLPAFLYPQPCPAALSVDLPFDTTGLANGSHELLVTVLDAAGNATTVLKRTITVANPAISGNGGGGATGGEAGSGSPGGGSTGSGGGSTGGNGGSGSTGGGSSGSTGGATAGTAVVGPANGIGASSDATLTAAWRRHRGERLADGYGAVRVIEGRLTAPGGTPIADAEVEVGERPAYAGAGVHAVAVARTAADGDWSLRLPRGLPSGVLLVAYRAQVGAATPAATRTLTLVVRAGVSLAVAPRVAAAQGEIRFRGRLLGGPVPPGGKQVVLEARSPGGRWLEFRVVRARSGGRFAFAYRFRLAGPVRYQFRAVSEAEADYPYGAGSSNVVGVYER